MSQSPVSPHFPSTSPTFQQDKDISLPIPSNCFPTQLVSSPVTPTSAPRWQFSFPPLPEEHTLILRSFREQASRHRLTDVALLRDIAQVGNAPYLTQRHVIIQWMIDVATTFHFLSTTLHLAVHHVDMFMASRFLSRDLWQLVAVSAIFIAAKCEEPASRIPVLDDLKFICDNAFTQEHIRQMEVCMLRALDWDLVVKTPVHFCNQFLTMLHSIHHSVRPDTDRARGATRGEASRTQGAETAEAAEAAGFPSPYVSEVRAAGALHNLTADVDVASSDGEMESYSLVSAAGSDVCSCEDPSDSCSCEAALQEEHHTTGPSAAGISTSGIGASRAISPVSTPEGPHEARPRRTNSVESEAQSPLRSLVRTATCFLDVSLHDASLRTRYPPDVLAAAALELAATVGPVQPMTVGLSTDLIAYVADLGKEAIHECRVGLWNAFVEAQK